MSSADHPNPFEAPEVEHTHQAGEGGVLDISVALTDGMNAMKSYFGVWFLTMFVAGILLLLSAILLLPIIFVWPVLFWGMVKFTLKTVDGDPELGDLFSGFSIYGTALVGMLGWGILYMLISIPGNIISQGASFFGDEAILLMGIGFLVSIAWSAAVVVRFQLAWYYIVDQGMGVVDSFRTSWHVTRDQKLNLVLFWLVTSLIPMVGLLFLIVGIFPALMIAGSAWASAFRQLSGTRPAV